MVEKCDEESLGQHSKEQREEGVEEGNGYDGRIRCRETSKRWDYALECGWMVGIEDGVAEWLIRLSVGQEHKEKKVIGKSMEIVLRTGQLEGNELEGDRMT